MPEVRTIAIIGAGSLGQGIAHVAALAGYRTILEDLLPSALRRAESDLRANLRQAGGGAENPLRDPPFSLLEFAGHVEDAARAADLVIEAGPEELESKIEIFTLLDKICRPGTVLASSTLTFSITEIARVTYRAESCLAMRFAVLIDRAKGLEIVRGAATSDSAVASVVEVGRRMGKEVRVTQEAVL